MAHAHSTEDVVSIVKVANTHRTPVVPYSGGTSLEGQVLNLLSHSMYSEKFD